MKFGDTPLDEAEGAILAHSVRCGRTMLKKGRRLSADDISVLAEAGIASVVAARLDPGDVHEDTAAARLADAAAGDGVTAAAPFTGRVNLFTARRGLCVVDRDTLDRVNRVDEALTIATVPAFAPVEPDQMVATIKIIPFAAPEARIAEAEALLAGASAIRVAPFRARRAGLIQTRLSGTKPSVLDKTVGITAERLATIDGTLVTERRCDHAVAAVAGEIAAVLAAGADLLLIAGASAITDRCDVLPAAIEAAGGTIDHFGMPVDPGNLLLIGRLGDRSVIGLPGCARSPKLNGFDWVLQRLAADLPVGRDEIMAMGVGGLLTEIPTRPLPRAKAAPETAPPHAPRVAAIVLAAGQSRRMGARNKLLASIDGAPMVARTVDAALASRADPVIVITGHEPERIRAALADRAVTFVHNPDFARGLSTSLKAGLAALPDTADATLVCLGDMPLVTADEIDRLIAAYDPAEGRAIVLPTRGGKRGNPVLWDRRFFPDMARVAGDVGARHLIGENTEQVAEVEMDRPGVLVDIDTPEALEAVTAD